MVTMDAVRLHQWKFVLEVNILDNLRNLWIDFKIIQNRLFEFNKETQTDNDGFEEWMKINHRKATYKSRTIIYRL